MRLWDVATGGPIGTPLTGQHRCGDQRGVQPRWAALASASNDTTVRLWDLDTGQPVGTPLTGHSRRSPAWRSAPTGIGWPTPADTTIRLWSADTGSRSAAADRGDGPVMSVAFSPDGRRIATAGQDGTVRLWDADTGQLGSAH